MRNGNTHIRDEAAKVRIDPPRNAWKRVEVKLEADRSHRRMRIARLLNYAAAVVVICVIAVAAYYTTSITPYGESRIYSLSMEPLKSNPDHAGTIYSVENVKQMHDVWGSDR